MDEEHKQGFFDLSSYLGQLSKVSVEQAVITERLSHVVSNIENVHRIITSHDERIKVLEDHKSVHTGKWNGWTTAATVINAVVLLFIFYKTAYPH